MKTVTNVSGGRTSAYLAANYPTDELVFSLVRIEDERCRFPDEAVRRLVEDKIQAPFIATAEDDVIIYTMLDLEQFLGRAINWVTGPTFEWIIANHRGGGYLPNKLHRFCTTDLKVAPIFNWWLRSFGLGNPIVTSIGYRANETKRANKMLASLNNDGLLEFETSFEKHPNGDNKWVTIPWQHLRFPLIEDGIKKPSIYKYWQDKPVRFADYNNCIGCHTREPLFLRFMFQRQPTKMRWFKEQEVDGMFWQIGHTYAQIEKLMEQQQLYPEDFDSCDTGFCEIEN